MALRSLILITIMYSRANWFLVSCLVSPTYSYLLLRHSQLT